MPASDVLKYLGFVVLPLWRQRENIESCSNYVVDQDDLVCTLQPEERTCLHSILKIVRGFACLCV